MKFLMCHIMFIRGDKMNNVRISRSYRNGPNVLPFKRVQVRVLVFNITIANFFKWLGDCIV